MGHAVLILQEHEGQRSFAYPGADTRASSFCSSGDSVDSNGTSAEGIDSEGEAHGSRLLSAGAKPRPIALQGGLYGYDPSGSSGHTSTATTALNSPSHAGHSTFLAAQLQHQQQLKRAQLNAPKNKGDIARKRSRDSIKTMVPTDHKPVPFSPKKGAYTDPQFAGALKGRPDPDVHPSRAHSTSSPVGPFRSGLYGAGGSNSSSAPGPLYGLPDDLGAGMGLGLEVNGQDLFFPSFPDDPTCSYTGALGSHSNDTDLTNPYYSQHPSGCSSGLSHHHIFDDADLANILGTIDWDEPVPTHVGSVSSTSTNSRPHSPATDSASSVGTAPAYAVYGGRSGYAITVAAPLSPKKIPSPIPSSQALSALTQAQPQAMSMPQYDTVSTMDDAPVAKKHRVAFSNVLEELELVSEAVRVGSTSSAPGASTDADHISLFDLFQRDSAQTVGRLPPLRALVLQARERRNNHHSTTAINGIAAISSDCAAPGSASGNHSGPVDFDSHEFDFGGLMDDEPHPMDGHVLSPEAPHHAASVIQDAEPTASDDASNLFANGTSILDASGAINPGAALLTINMMPTAPVGSAPNSASNTPSVAQRKRGRPRKHSISGPSGPVGTPGAATAKSLLPALTHSALHGTQFHPHALPEGQGYLVPVNAAVAQAYNYAVSTALAASDTGAYSPRLARSTSSDGSLSNAAHLASFRVNLTSTSGNCAEYPTGSYMSGHYFGADIRLGMSRTMSSESDTMMAAVFDPRLTDEQHEISMLEDFE
jgi:hypothetical protein